jgi:hypothetical protein
VGVVLSPGVLRCYHRVNRALGTDFRSVLSGKEIDMLGGRFFRASVTIYSPGANGNATPVHAISGSQTGLYIPVGIAVR